MVGLTAIDEAKARVVALEKEHAKLVDAHERAVHLHAKLTEELQVAVQAYRKTVKDRDKYVILTDQLRAEHEAQLAQREETEIEDIFSTRRRRAA